MKSSIVEAWDLLGQILRRDLYKDRLPQTSPQDAGLPSLTIRNANTFDKIGQF